MTPCKTYFKLTWHTTYRCTWFYVRVFTDGSPGLHSPCVQSKVLVDRELVGQLHITLGFYLPQWSQCPKGNNWNDYLTHGLEKRFTTVPWSLEMLGRCKTEWTIVKSSKSDILCSTNLYQFNEKLPSWKPTYPLPAGTFEDDFFFPRWDMLVPWRVSIMKKYRMVTQELLHYPSTQGRPTVKKEKGLQLLQGLSHVLFNMLHMSTVCNMQSQAICQNLVISN